MTNKQIPFEESLDYVVQELFHQVVRDINFKESHEFCIDVYLENNPKDLAYIVSDTALETLENSPHKQKLRETLANLFELYLLDYSLKPVLVSAFSKNEEFKNGTENNGTEE